MEKLVSYLVNTTWEDLAVETIEAGKNVLLDSLAALILGNQEDEIGKLAALAEKQAPGLYPVFGTSRRTNLHDAAFINGCGGVATEMDEGNQWSKGHPAAHIVPALLTYAQLLSSCTGKDFLLALITGYEACSRFGRAVTLLPAAHAHGTWGVMGTAASIMLLKKSSVREMVEGIKMSASFALPTMWNAALEGALVRNAYAGHAIEMGIRAVDLVQSGFHSPEQAVEHVFGSVLGSQFNYGNLLQNLGGEWDIEHNYFKPYAFCRYAHAPLDAFHSLLDQYEISVDCIEKIEVRTYSRAATLCNNKPHNVLSAKFSIPYALAVQWVTGKAGPDSFSRVLFENQDIQKIAGKVHVIADDELEKEYPTIMPAVVKVVETNGGVYEARCDIANGGPGRLLQKSDIENKFMTLTAGILSSEKQRGILKFISNIENEKSISDLYALL